MNPICISRKLIITVAVAAGRLAAVVAVVAAVLVPVAPPAGAVAAAGGTQLWAATVATKNVDVAGSGTAVSPDGKTVFVTGQAAENDFGEIVGPGITVAYNAATGAKRWQATYNPGQGSDTQLSSIAVSPDGSTVFVSGDSGTVPSSPMLLTVAYNAATGAMLWERTGGVTSGIPWPLAVSPDGSTVFVTSATRTVAYNAATGAERWENTVHGDAIAVSADSSAVFITGYLKTGSGAVIEALNAATGARRWRAEYRHGPHGMANFTSLGVSPDGSTVFAAGTTGNANLLGDRPRLVTVAYDAATGAQRWADASGQTLRFSAINGLTVDPGGSAVFIAEDIETSATTNSFYQVTAALDPATGATLWQRILKAPSGARHGTQAQPYAIAASPDGATVFVTGSETKKVNATEDRLYADTTAYRAATGTTRWTALYTKGFWTFPFALAVSPDGSRVVIAGASEPSPYNGVVYSNMATVAYSS